jgi:NTP pyrophosphatase (non-canonical NTP hydrolase)
MTFEDFQAEANRTINPEHDEFKLGTFGLELSSDAGDVAELIKQFLVMGGALNRNALREKLGDVLRSLTKVAAESGLNLEDIALTNRAKIRGTVAIRGGGNAD